MRRGAVCTAGCLAVVGAALVSALVGPAGTASAQALLAIKQMERDYVALVPLNVHQRPSEDSVKVEHLKEGTPILVTGEVTGTKWFRVITEQKRLGYVLGNLIQPATEKVAADSDPEPDTETPAEPAPGFQDCPTCPRMVRLPNGAFTMGDASGDSSEQPVRRVEISYSFALGRSEVTVAQWMACVEGGGCTYTPDPVEAPETTPMRNVSWDDARGYARWLAKTTGKAYRLPSEAEWEYAARGGTATAYWWGADVGSGRADCRDCGGEWDRRAPRPVTAYAENPFRLLGMNGGVAEWTADCWIPDYRNAPRDGSARQKRNCRQRVLRGGSWRHKARDLRSAARLFYDADVQYSAHGFRVALTLEN